MIIHPQHADIDPKALRANAVQELASGVPLPAAMEQIRRGHVEHLRGQGSVMRGVSDAAIEYFRAVLMAGLPDPSMLDTLAIEIHLTPEHRRMFPELPDTDMLLAGTVDGRFVVEPANYEARS